MNTDARASAVQSVHDILVAMDIEFGRYQGLAAHLVDAVALAIYEPSDRMLTAGATAIAKTFGDPDLDPADFAMETYQGYKAMLEVLLEARG